MFALLCVNCQVLEFPRMQAAQKKRLEEKNAKQIRELAAQPANRNCFECGQRGPTYVNITEGSFCCTGCSGILRGLNPPYRVKSISMASFTTDEVEKLRSLGNAENAKIWLGLYSGSPPAMTNREQIQAFLVKKYEKKTWYVSKAEVTQQERLMNQAREAKEASSRTDSHDTSSVTSGSKPTDLDLFSIDPFGPTVSSSQQQKVANNITINSSSQPFSPPAWLAPPPPFSFDDKLATTTTAPANTAPSLQSQQIPVGGAIPVQTAPVMSNNPQILGAPSAPITARNAQQDIFADFESKFNDLNFRTSNTVSAFDNISHPISASLPKSATVDSGISGLLQPSPAGTNPFQQPSVPIAPVAVSPPLQSVPTTVDSTINASGSSADKYSALAELDELFHHTGAPQGDSKATWMPSGFSTGIPPSSTTHNVHQMGQTNGGVKPMMNGLGSFPKSNTMGSIADYGVNNPFLTTQTNACLQGAFPNPFATPTPAVPVGGYPMASQQWATQPNTIMPTQPPIPARPPAVSSSNSSWNPFL